MDFTDVTYHLDTFKNKNNIPENNQLITITVQSLDSITVSFTIDEATLSHTSNHDQLLTHLETNIIKEGKAIIILEFSKNLSFQDYITLKHVLSKIDLKNVNIADDEFVFN